jgi:hypothetical protein
MFSLQLMVILEARGGMQKSGFKARLPVTRPNFSMTMKKLA